MFFKCSLNMIKSSVELCQKRQMCNIPRRALMYVPGSDVKKLTKAFTLDVDCIAMDCEDGVALNKKEDARNIIREILDKGKPSKEQPYDLGVRLNAVQTEFFESDLINVLQAKHLPDTVLLPKVDSAADLKHFLEIYKKYCRSSEEKLNLIMYIESAKGFINLREICDSASTLSPQILPVALVFGSDDFCADIGVTRSQNSMEIIYARQKLVLYAKAYGLQAIDMVYIDYKDVDGLQKQCSDGARMGYTGKQVIHPGQVAVVQEAFLPSDAQIEYARGLLDEFQKHQDIGKGAFTYKGSMIDMPTMRQAENIVRMSHLKRK